MSDVEIVFPQGREALARRLHEALVEAGFDVGDRAVDTAEPASAVGDAGAVLILWDRSTMAHPGLQAVASAARKRGRAIDVSVDGITPLHLADDRGLIHLSGWRGDTYHPGWRKILARLDQLSHVRRQPMPARPAAPPRRVDAPAAAASGRADEAAPRRRGRAVFVLAAVALLLIAAVAGLLMFRHQPAANPPPQAPMAAEAPTAAAPPATAHPPTQPMPAQSGQGTPPAPTLDSPRSTAAAAAAAQPVPPVEAQSPSASEPERPPANGTPAPHRPRVKKSSHAQRRPAIRYTRYSGNMRLFCERSGRGTPECRVFKAATRK
jgi:hypothetical protein